MVSLANQYEDHLNRLAPSNQMEFCKLLRSVPCTTLGGFITKMEVELKFSDLLSLSLLMNAPEVVKIYMLHCYTGSHNRTVYFHPDGSYCLKAGKDSTRSSINTITLAKRLRNDASFAFLSLL